jgi:hypothetical protein
MLDLDPNSSNINIWALVFLVAMSLVVFGSTRRNAVIAVLLTALLVPLGQQFVVFDLHFRFSRILIIVGILRVLVRAETQDFRLTKVDRLFFFWTLVTLGCWILRGARAETFGLAYDALGTYFLFRVWMDDARDTISYLRVLAVVAAVVAVCMSIELFTRRNVFYVFGGVPEITVEREGRFRCQGPFRHPILAGTFAATLFPLMVGLWLQGGRNKTRAFLGIVSSAFCSYVAASSGALLTLIGAVIGLGLWPMHNRMYIIRRGIVVTIIGLAIFMKVPVWFLISRISDLTGGTGWHRAYLIDQAIKHFDEWWLIGSSFTAHWASNPFMILGMDPDNMDITNHYVGQGLNGGFFGLVLFIAIIVTCFKIVGHAVHIDNDSFFTPQLKWTLGVSLIAHCLAFFSVSYFDQIQVYWFWLLAVISSLSLHMNREPELQEVERQLVSPDEVETAAVPLSNRL